MNYPVLIHAFLSTPWALTQEKYDQIRAFLRLKADGGEISAEEVQQIVAARRNDNVQMVGRIAILPVQGVISQRVGAIERCSGGVGTEEIGASLDALVADKQVKTIVMAFDSPGGSVFGVPELATRIRAARDQKRIVGFADPMAASAAYWLMSQTSETWVTPSGQVGSIGVITTHEDMSEKKAQKGVKTSYVTSSKYKAEGNPDEPLNEEARAEMQSKVNAYHSMFVADIAKGRDTTVARVEKDFGEGRMMTATAAKSAGMVDRIGTLDDVLKRYGDGDSARAEGVPANILAIARARAIEVENS